MIFAGIDVDIILHEKAVLAGPEAMGLWLWGMCYAQKYATNGRLPRSLVLGAFQGRRNIMLARKLVASGLWSEHEDGSWSIWNYAKKNQTAEEIAARREERKQANAARQQRWRNARNADVTQSNAGVSALRSVTITGEESEPSPEPTPTPEPVNKIGPALTLPALEVGSAGGGRRRKPETPCPGSEATPEAVAAWAATWRLPTTHAEFDHFLDHHRKHDKRWRDWAAAWRTWLKNAPRFGARSGARGAEITKQGFDPDAPWMKLPEVS